MWIVSKETFAQGTLLLATILVRYTNKMISTRCTQRLFGYMPYISLAKKAGPLGCLFHNHIAIISGA